MTEAARQTCADAGAATINVSRVVRLGDDVVRRWRTNGRRDRQPVRRAIRQCRALLRHISQGFEVNLAYQIEAILTVQGTQKKR